MDFRGVCKGLKFLREQNPNDELYVILDHAAYQCCKKVKDFAVTVNINLIFLPLYSPNLNLIEYLWGFLRSKLLANRYYSSFRNFLDSIHDFLASLHLKFLDDLSSLLTFNFQCLDENLCSI